MITLLPFVLSFVLFEMISKIKHMIPSVTLFTILDFLQCYKCLLFWSSFLIGTLYGLYFNIPIIESLLQGAKLSTINIIIYYIIEKSLK